MSSPVTRFIGFIRANGGFGATLRLAVRKLWQRGLIYTFRALCSNLSPVPRFPERRYRHYIARHEQADLAWLCADIPGTTLPSVLLVACAASADPLTPSDTQRAPNWHVTRLSVPFSAATLNNVLRDSSAHYAAILWPQDRLAPQTAAIVNAAIRGNDILPARADAPGAQRPTTNARPTLLYSDEDQLDSRGRRCRPHFKPDWSPDTLLDWPYSGNLCLFDRQAALDCGGFCDDFVTADALLYDLVLRLSEQSPLVYHIPVVLYHRHAAQRPGPQSTDAQNDTGHPSLDLWTTEINEVRRRAAARLGLAFVFESAPPHDQWAATRPDLGFAPLLSLPRLRPLPTSADAVDGTGSGLRDLDSDAPSANSTLGVHSQNVPTTLDTRHSTLGAQHPTPNTNTQQPTTNTRIPPLISLIIPTRDHVVDLTTCIASVLARSTYPALEIMIIDNGSQEPETLRYLERIATGLRTATGAEVPVRVMRLDIPFNFSLLNNRAAAQAAGDYLLFLNNDTEVVTPDWIERMLGHACKPWAGAVGATLLYPDGTIQHAGVAKVGLGPTHVFGHLPADYPHPRCQRDGNWSAVTAACMLISAAKFRAVDGFDESLAIAFNDVDLCYRLLDKGWPSILTSQARLIHHEFKTRGNDRASAAKHARLLDELEHLYSRWPALRHDPYYNPALSISYPDFLPRNSSGLPF